MTRPASALIDIHAHFSLPSTPAARHAAWEASRRRQHFLAPEPYEWRLDGTLAYMDETGTAMQMLSTVPNNLESLRASNDYGVQIVATHPTRFGLLAALPTDDPQASLAEIQRVGGLDGVDGWAVSTVYNGQSLAADALDPLWQQLDDRHAVVFVHPNAYAPAVADLPTPLVEVAFDTGRTVVSMLYAGVFARFPNITFVIAHAGGAVPLLAGRLGLIGTEPWVPNPHNLGTSEIETTLRRLWVDTAASASDQQLTAAAATFGEDHLVFGSDWGVPCTDKASALRNIRALLCTEAIGRTARAAVPDRAHVLFPQAARRAQSG
ncbi:amidohydrolase family protein [Amycolatopsis pigmentata]|uniref:6-methylsalicylate decarboxylase n=1 Tax=Amycolatopsis pigmentata TaxID=450801 RepID=A0ABW5FJ53_9PSEU